MQDARPLISIVSPAYNEESNLELFHDEICEATAGGDFDIEFVIVDDGSRDATADVLRRLAEKDPRVRALILSRNFGAISAATAGLQAAVGDAAILMSCDLQDPASNVPKFVARWREGYDIVWAIRRSRSDPLAKRLFAGSFYWLIRKIVFADYPEAGTDSGLFDRKALDVYRSLPERDSSPFYAIYSYGFRQGFIEYDRRPRVHGESGWSFWRRAKNALDVITSFSVTPLRLIERMALATLLVAAAGFVFVFFHGLVFGAETAGWTSLMLLALLASGFQILALRMIAGFTWRIGEQTRQRPRYIVAASYGASAPRPVRPLPNSLDLGPEREAWP